MRHSETVASDVLQHVSSIHFQHSDIRHTAVESDTDMVCLHRRLRTDIRLRFRMTG